MATSCASSLDPSVLIPSLFTELGGTGRHPPVITRIDARTREQHVSSASSRQWTWRTAAQGVFQERDLGLEREQGGRVARSSQRIIFCEADARVLSLNHHRS